MIYSGATAPDFHRLPPIVFLCILIDWMATRVTTHMTLLCQPATAALRAGRFPADEPLDSDQVDDVASLAAALGQPDKVLCSPARCARDTAMALGLSPTVEADLREVNYGCWAGRSLKEIGTAEPTELAAWLSDPEMNAHGGESLSAAIERVRLWIEQRPWPSRHTLVITHASVIKAIVLHTLNAPAIAYWQLDIAPLATITLSLQRGRWRLHVGGPLR